MDIFYFTYSQLLLYGVHIGHSFKNTHLYAGWLIYAYRQNILIINLYKTFFQIRNAIHYVVAIASKHNPVWFVNLDAAMSTFVKTAAQSCGEFAVTGFWINGLMSNYQGLVLTFQKLYKMSFNSWRARIKRADKIFGDFLFTRMSWPRAVVVSSVKNSYMVPKEAFHAGAGCLGIVDTDTWSDTTSGPIPGNDDSLLCLVFFNELMAKAVLNQKYHTIIRWFFGIRNYSRLNDFWEWLNLNYLSKKELSSSLQNNSDFIRKGMSLFCIQNYSLGGSFEDVEITYPTDMEFWSVSKIINNYWLHLRTLIVTSYAQMLNKNFFRIVFQHRPVYHRRLDEDVYNYYDYKYWVHFNKTNPQLTIWTKNYFYKNLFLTNRHFRFRAGHKDYIWNRFIRKFINIFHVNRYLRFKGLSTFRSFNHFNGSYYFLLAKYWTPNLIKNNNKYYLRSFLRNQNVFNKGFNYRYNWTKSVLNFLNTRGIFKHVNNSVSMRESFYYEFNYYKNMYREYSKLKVILESYSAFLFNVKKLRSFRLNNFLKKDRLYYLVYYRWLLYSKRFFFYWLNFYKFIESSRKFIKMYRNFSKNFFKTIGNFISYFDLINDLEWFNSLLNKKVTKDAVKLDFNFSKLNSLKFNFIKIKQSFRFKRFCKYFDYFLVYLNSKGLNFKTFYIYKFLDLKYSKNQNKLNYLSFKDYIYIYIYNLYFDFLNTLDFNNVSYFYFFFKVLYFNLWKVKYFFLLNGYSFNKKKYYLLEELFTLDYKFITNKNIIRKYYTKLNNFINNVKHKDLRNFLKYKFSQWIIFSYKLPILNSSTFEKMDNFFLLSMSYNYNSKYSLFNFFLNDFKVFKLEGFWIFSKWTYDNVINYKFFMQSSSNLYSFSSFTHDWFLKLQKNTYLVSSNLSLNKTIASSYFFLLKTSINSLLLLFFNKLRGHYLNLLIYFNMFRIIKDLSNFRFFVKSTLVFDLMLNNNFILLEKFNTSKFTLFFNLFKLNNDSNLVNFELLGLSKSEFFSRFNPYRLRKFSSYAKGVSIYKVFNLSRFIKDKRNKKIRKISSHLLDMRSIVKKEYFWRLFKFYKWRYFIKFKNNYSVKNKKLWNKLRVFLVKNLKNRGYFRFWSFFRKIRYPWKKINYENSLDIAKSWDMLTLANPKRYWIDYTWTFNKTNIKNKRQNFKNFKIYNWNYSNPWVIKKFKYRWYIWHKIFVWNELEGNVKVLWKRKR